MTGSQTIRTPERTLKSTPERVLWCVIIQDAWEQAAKGHKPSRDFFATDMWETVSAALFTPAERANIEDAAYQAYDNFHTNGAATGIKTYRKLQWSKSPSARAHRERIRNLSPEELKAHNEKAKANYHHYKKLKQDKLAAKQIPTVRNIVWPTPIGEQHANPTA